MVAGAAVSSIWCTVGLGAYVSEAFPGMIAATLAVLLVTKFTKKDTSANEIKNC